MKFASILLIICAMSCETKQQKEYKQAMSFVDSLARERKIDSMTKSSIDGVYKNIADEQSAKSAASAPIQIISAKFVKKEYSNYKDVRLVWKNISSKKIVGVKFGWTGVNAFGEQADVGGYGGIGGGFDDDPLSPGKTTSGTWSILSRDGKTITKSWVTEVAFADGTKWEVK